MKRIFKQLGLLSLLTCTPLMAAATMPATANCEFIMGNNFGICFQNQTNETLDNKAALNVTVTLGGFTQKSRVTTFSPFPNNWYADSYTSIKELTYNNVSVINYTLTINNQLLPSCELTFTGPFTPMPKPRLLKILKSGTEYHCE